MITYCCDRCKYTSQGENIHEVAIPHHIVNPQSAGYVDGMFQPTSGRQITFHLCSKCNNEALTLLHDHITANT